MAKDLTIRELSRPQISKDNMLGFQKVVRKYVVQGDRVNQTELNAANSPLFEAVGTTDTEYTDHYLVNQQITPATGDMDRAYLTREFVQLRNQFFSEAVQESRDIIRLKRKYAVLRNSDSTFGYGSNWNKHPNNPSATAHNSGITPWDYRPAIVEEPAQKTYDYTNNSGFTQQPQVSINGGQQSLYDYLKADVGSSGMGLWLPGGASVTQYMPGLDVWEVEWATHPTPYWSLGTARGGGSRSTPLTYVDFDDKGLKLEQFGGSGSSSYNRIARTNVFFYVGEMLPDSILNVTGGSDSSFQTSSVNLDFSIRLMDGRVITYKQFLRNAVFMINTAGRIRFPSESNPGGLVVVGEKTNKNITFDGIYFADTPLFQGMPVMQIGGRITWTRGHNSSNLGSSSGYFGSAGSRVTPIFSYGAQKIWKIEVTYVG